VALGAAGRRGLLDSGELAALAAGGRLGRGLGTREGRFRHLAGPVVAPASGAPAASECGRRGCRSRRAGRARFW
jgi:hypothetical protein